MILKLTIQDAAANFSLTLQYTDLFIVTLKDLGGFSFNTCVSEVSVFEAWVAQEPWVAGMNVADHKANAHKNVDIFMR